MLVAMYDHWHQEQRLAAIERGDLGLVSQSQSPAAKLCKAFGKCCK